MSNVRRLPLEIFPPYSSDAPKLIDEADAALETYKDHLLGLQWNDLHNQSAVLAGVADKILRDIQARSDLEDLWSDTLSDRDSEIRNAFSSLSADSSPASQQALDALLAELTQQMGGDAVAAQAALDALLDGSSPALNSRKTKKSIVADDQDLLTSSYAQLAAAANTASIEANIRLAYEKTDANAAIFFEDGDLALINKEIDNLHSLHDGALNRLYNLLKNDADSDTFLEACTAEQSRIAKRLPTSAMIAGGSLALVKRTPSATDKTTHYAQVLRVFELIERLQVLHAYTGMVRAGLATVDPGRWYSNEKRRVDDRQAQTKQPLGTPTAIAGLNSTSLPDSEFITLKGLVDNIRIEDDPSPPKFSTFFDLIDIESGEKVQVRAHMFSLINNGLANGAYTSINGFLRKNESWVSDVGLEIDRLSLSELRKDSWNDDVTYRVRKFYRLYLDEMNMFNTPFIG